MATVIDALIVTLGLDATNFQKGEKEVSTGLKKTKDQSTDVAKTMEQNGKKAGAFFGSIRNELLALIGITLSLKGMKDLIIGTANNMAQLGRSAAPLNMSARDLDAWQTTAKATGGTAEGLTGSMQSLSDSIYAFSIGKGGTEAINTLNALGIAAVDAQGKAKSMGDIYLEVSEQFQKRKLSIGMARQYGAGLGMDAATINMLMEGPEKVKALQNEMYNRSGVSPEAVARSQKFQETWAKIEQTFEGVRQKLFTALIPYIEQLLGQLDKFATWVSTHQNEINKFFKDTAETIATVTDAVGGVQNAFEILLAFVALKWTAGMLGAISKVGKGLGGITSLVSAAGIYATVAAGSEVVGRTKAMINGEPYDQIQGNNAELSELEKLKRANWARNYPGKPYPEAARGIDNSAQDRLVDPTQHAQSSRRSMSDNEGYDSRPNETFNDDYSRNQSAPRGIRNNNPGNLNYAGQRGAEKENGPNGRFAVFPSMIDGIAALYRQLKLYAGRGIDTISEIVKKYAPAADNNNVGAYISSLMKATGKGANEALNPEDTDTMVKLIRGIVNHENGMGHVDDKQILAGVQVGSVMSATSGSNTTTTSSRSETNIQNLNVNTQATDARTIANELPGHIRRQGLVAAANGGMS